MSSSFSSTKKRKDVWRNNERHYCEVCNTWMGSDRQSILIHENGKKHQENVELALKKKRSEKQQQEQQQSFLESSLQQMERAAAAAVTGGTGGGSSAGGGGGPGHSVAPGGRMNMPYRLHQPQPPPAAMGGYYPQVAPRGVPPPHQQYYHGQPPPPPGPPPPHQQQYHPAAAFPPPPPPPLRPPPPPRPSQQPKPSSSSVSEVNDWHAKKQKREQEELEKKQKRRDGIDGDGEDDDENVVVTKDPKRRRILPGEGYYIYDEKGEHDSSTNTTMKKINIKTTTDKLSETATKEKEEEGTPSKAEEETSKVIYLEGKVYYGLLQDDLPVELWTGSNQATDQELKSVSNRYLWKPALVIQVQQKGNGDDNEDTKEDEGSFSTWTAHVSYLATPNDEDETILKRVPARLLRIQLGQDDEKIPDTLEEARLLAMGGEEVVVVKTNENQKTAAAATTKSEASDGDADAGDVSVDEATGLSGWSTVSVHRTTVKQQAREERERHAEKRRLAKLEKEVEAKRMEERRMEEAKVGNADDSALGAYDVFGRGGGYKGVDIGPGAGATASGGDGGGPLLSVDDTAKRLASTNGDNDGSGGPVKVPFRKFNKKKKKKGGARRTTSADDDD